MLRFTHDRNTKLVALGLSVEPHYWNKDAEMLTSDCPERAILQSKIDSALAVYRKKINRLEALDVPVNFDTLFEPTTRKAGITIEDGLTQKLNDWNRSAKSIRPPNTNTLYKCWTAINQSKPH